MHKFGDVLLAEVQYVDTFEVKERPALVLFEEHGNIVVAGVTTNVGMEGVPLSTKEGMRFDSVIKLNYIFTISESKVKRKLLEISQEKKNIIRQELMRRLI